MSIFICEYCKKHFIANSTLRRHVRLFHKDSPLPEVRRRGRKSKQPSDDSKFVTCDICDKKQVNKKALAYHRKREHEHTDSEEQKQSERTASQFANFTAAQPTLFYFPVHLQVLALECTSHNIKHNTAANWLGTTNDQRSQINRSKTRKTGDHSYCLQSPMRMKCQLDTALKALATAKKKLKFTQQRNRRLKRKLDVLLEAESSLP